LREGRPRCLHNCGNAASLRWAPDHLVRTVSIPEQEIRPLWETPGDSMTLVGLVPVPKEREEEKTRKLPRAVSSVGRAHALCLCISRDKGHGINSLGTRARGRTPDLLHHLVPMANEGERLIEPAAELFELAFEFGDLRLQCRNAIRSGEATLDGGRRFVHYVHITRKKVRPALLFVTRLARKFLHKLHLEQAIQRALHTFQVVE